MRKRIIRVLNWDKYQARTDKDLPWCKLWGTIFDRPWFQKMSSDFKYMTLVFLDLARKTGNRITEEYVFIEYLSGNYGVRMLQKDVFILCKSLSSNGFLSDNVDDLQDKTRQDKMSESDKQSDETDSFKKFWDLYPKRKSKAVAEKSWKKIDPEDYDKIFSGVERAKSSEQWNKDGGRYIPYPASWLNARGWEDEDLREESSDIWSKTHPQAV